MESAIHMNSRAVRTNGNAALDLGRMLMDRGSGARVPTKTDGVEVPIVTLPNGDLERARLALGEDEALARVLGSAGFQVDDGTLAPTVPRAEIVGTGNPLDVGTPGAANTEPPSRLEALRDEAESGSVQSSPSGVGRTPGGRILRLVGDLTPPATASMQAVESAHRPESISEASRVPGGAPLSSPTTAADASAIASPALVGSIQPDVFNPFDDADTPETTLASGWGVEPLSDLERSTWVDSRDLDRRTLGDTLSAVSDRDRVVAQADGQSSLGGEASVAGSPTSPYPTTLALTEALEPLIGMGVPEQDELWDGIAGSAHLAAESLPEADTAARMIAAVTALGVQDEGVANSSAGSSQVQYEGAPEINTTPLHTHPLGEDPGVARETNTAADLSDTALAIAHGAGSFTRVLERPGAEHGGPVESRRPQVSSLAPEPERRSQDPNEAHNDEHDATVESAPRLPGEDAALRGAESAPRSRLNDRFIVIVVAVLAAGILGGMKYLNRVQPHPVTSLAAGEAVQHPPAPSDPRSAGTLPLPPVGEDSGTVGRDVSEPLPAVSSDSAPSGSRGVATTPTIETAASISANKSTAASSGLDARLAGLEKRLVQLESAGATRAHGFNSGVPEATRVAMATGDAPAAGAAASEPHRKRPARTQSTSPIAQPSKQALVSPHAISARTLARREGGHDPAAPDLPVLAGVPTELSNQVEYLGTFHSGNQRVGEILVDGKLVRVREGDLVGGKFHVDAVQDMSVTIAGRTYAP